MTDDDRRTLYPPAALDHGSLAALAPQDHFVLVQEQDSAHIVNAVFKEDRTAARGAGRTVKGRLEDGRCVGIDSAPQQVGHFFRGQNFRHGIIRIRKVTVAVPDRTEVRNDIDTERIHLCRCGKRRHEQERKAHQDVIFHVHCLL